MGLPVRVDQTGSGQVAGGQQRQVCRGYFGERAAGDERWKQVLHMVDPGLIHPWLPASPPLPSGRTGWYQGGRCPGEVLGGVDRREVSVFQVISGNSRS